MRSLWISIGLGAVSAIAAGYEFYRPQSLSLCMIMAGGATIVPVLFGERRWSAALLAVVSAFCLLSAARWIIPLPVYLHEARMALRPGAALAVLVGILILSDKRRGSLRDAGDVWSTSLLWAAVAVGSGLAAGFVFLSLYYALKARTAGDVIFNLAVIWVTFVAAHAALADRNSRRGAGLFAACSALLILAANVWGRFS